MKIILGTDHAGFLLKEEVKKSLEGEGHDVVDVGAPTLQSGDDYPDYIRLVAEKISHGEGDRGIIFGGSGQGEAIVANRVKGIRAVVYYGGAEEIIRLSREHNDANILSLGARFLEKEESLRIISLWLSTPFSGEERHTRRIGKIDQ